MRQFLESGGGGVASNGYCCSATAQTVTSQVIAHMASCRRSTWTCIYSTGLKTILHSDKRGIIQVGAVLGSSPLSAAHSCLTPRSLPCALQKFKLGVPIRDMRLLDPNLLTSETGKILVRDNAIVFSIEHVRLIITADAVIIPREGFDHNPLNIRFNSLLEEVIADFGQARSRDPATGIAVCHCRSPSHLLPGSLVRWCFKSAL